MSLLSDFLLVLLGATALAALGCAAARAYAAILDPHHPSNDKGPP